MTTTKQKYHSFAAQNSVAIPIIQRDYVQGADINAKKRNGFLKAILEALLTPENDFEIDFIYGSTNDEKEFIPVDGQQRLTTLTLLAWLLNQKAGKAYSRQLPKLSYFTRPSTEQFCDHLFSYDLPNNYGTISTHLKNVPGWFSRRWEEDASVMAMLDFLDCADKILNSSDFKNNITSLAANFFGNNPVTFEYLDMNAMNLNDDLYIKMNARGKHLTIFENWKARFEQFLGKHFPATDYCHNVIPGLDKQPKILDYFIHAIEHDWCDMLWARAYRQWEELTPEQRRESAYPSIDNSFMNLFNYISQMLYFSSLPNASAIVKGKNTTLREMYKQNEESILDELYEIEENVVTLFRILDLFVEINNGWKNGTGFFDTIFTTHYDPSSIKINLYADTDINLFERCLNDKLDNSGEILLWSVISRLLKYRNQSLADTIKASDFFDYIRIATGMIRDRKQRLVNGLAVRPNIDQSDYHGFCQAINELLLFSDPHVALKQSTYSLLAAERRKENHYGTPAYDVIVGLSGNPNLYYCFNTLYQSLTSVTTKSEADAYIARFEKLMNLPNADRIRSLAKYGYRGVTVQNNHYFYGADGKWDFILTFDGDNSHIAQMITAWMTNQAALLFAPKQMNYYIAKYPEFIIAVFSPDNNTPHYYFYRKLTDQFTAWALKTYSSRPIMGYNTCPYAFTVFKRWTGDKLELWPVSYYSEHGLLEIYNPGDDERNLTMECVENGWEIAIDDNRRKLAKSFNSRYITDQNGQYVDSVGMFEFDGTTLLDRPGRDRIETAIDFLATL